MEQGEERIGVGSDSFEGWSLGVDGGSEAFLGVGVPHPVVGGGVDVGIGDGVDPLAVIDMPMAIEAGGYFTFAVGGLGGCEDVADFLLVFDAGGVCEGLVGEDERGEVGGCELLAEPFFLVIGDVAGVAAGVVWGCVIGVEDDAFPAVHIESVVTMG